jgi:hypothetical protein
MASPRLKRGRNIGILSARLFGSPPVQQTTLKKKKFE